MPTNPLGYLQNGMIGGARLAGTPPQPGDTDLSKLFEEDLTPEEYAQARLAILGRAPVVRDDRDLLRMQLEQAMKPPEQKQHVSTGGTVFGGLGDLLTGFSNKARQTDLLGQYQKNTTDLTGAAQKKAGIEALLSLADEQRKRREGLADDATKLGARQGFEAGENAKQRNFQRDMKKQDLDFDREKLTAAEKAKLAAADAKKTEDATKLEGSFRNDILGNQVTKDALGAVTAFKTIDTALKANTPAGDMTAVFSFMKTLDPNSSVREGEYASAQNAAAVPDQVRNYYNQAVKGLLLSPEQRKDFRGRAREAASMRAQAYQRFVDPYAKAIKEGGGDPSRVLPGIDLGALSDTVMVVPPGQTEAVPVHKSKLQDALNAGGKVIDG
jgi:hypothetical protein